MNYYKEEICNFCKRNNIDFESGEKYADLCIDGISVVCKSELDDTEINLYSTMSESFDWN